MTNAFSTRFFSATNEADVWDSHAQGWTGRVRAVSVFRDDRLMATLPQPERLRIARMAAKSGNHPAAYWWAQNATSPADRKASREYQR
jgi:hypothetical protein